MSEPAWLRMSPRLDVALVYCARRSLHLAVEPRRGGCCVTNCSQPKWGDRARCRIHALEQTRLTQDKPCVVTGCTKKRYSSTRSTSSLCREHLREASRRSKQKNNYAADGAHQRRRREAPWSWAPLNPWPDTCCVCGDPIDVSIRHGRESTGGKKHPDGETKGHEPPIAWLLNHPEYSGPLVLRPEHWRCNVAKGDLPDWELAG